MTNPKVFWYGIEEMFLPSTRVEYTIAEMSVFLLADIDACPGGQGEGQGHGVMVKGAIFRSPGDCLLPT